MYLKLPLSAGSRILRKLCKLCFSPSEYTKQDAMPLALADLEGYGSDSGSSILCSNSDVVPNYGQQDYDCTATSSESECDRIDATKFHLSTLYEFAVV